MTNGDSPAEGGLSDFFGRALDNLQGGNFASEPEPARESVSRHPAQIGPYKILRVVGQGGMGTVYLAEQDTPRRVVALKVIRAGFSGHEAERRFQRETEALGRLQHPGIAQIYNAGTADTGSGPQPYFAMEYIDGNPLLKYAKAISEGLPDTGVPASRLWPRHIQSRLELMVMICEAVQHAHRRGIIHRDLKPGNILVDRSGQPKILDFGVARMMDADASLTRQTDLGQLVGTLAYMSPEQAEGDPLAVDMRSDVYALGLILYELLAGKLPYEVSRAALQEAIRVIREEDPAPLSSIDRAFRGDIETIVAKTLEKDKERRYASAGDLAEDLKHHLRSEPIVARAPSALYQLQKFSQRNRALVAGTTAVMVALLGGAVVSTWQAVRARAAEKTALVQKSLAEQAGQKAIAGQELATAERARAERERNLAVESQTVALRERNSAIAEKRRADEQTASATAINTFLQKDLLAQADIANQGLGRLDPDLKVRTALDRAAAGIGGRFEGQPLVEATVRKTIGEAYQSLGVLPEARKQFERERELRQKAQGAEHAQTLECLLRLADLSDLQGRYQEGYTLAAETLKTLERTTKPDDDVRLKGMSGVAAAEEGLGRYTQALQIRNQVLAARRRNSGPEAPATLYEMAEVATNLASQNRLAEAEVMDRQIYEIRRRVLGPENPSTVGALLNIAAVVDEQKKFAEAEKLDLEILEIQRRVRGPDHPETLAAMNNLAIVYREEGKLTESERLLVETLTGKRKQFGPEHPSTLITMGNLASNYLSQRRFAESQALYRQSLEARRRTLGPDHQSTQVAIQNLALAYAQDRRFGEAEAQFHDLAESARRSGDPASRPLQSAMRGLALMLARQGKRDEAETAERWIIQSQTTLAGPQSPAVMNAKLRLVALLLTAERYAECEPLVRDALEMKRAKQPEDWTRWFAETLLGTTLAARKNFTDAEPLLLAGYKGMEARKSKMDELDTFRLDESRRWLAALYRAWGKPESALPWEK